MNKFVAVYTACSLLVLLMAGQAAQHSSDEDQSAAGSSASSAASSFNNLDNEDEIEEELESEMELKKMLMYVTPLMGIFQKHKQKWGSAFKRSVDYDQDDHENTEELDTSSMVEEGRKRGRRPPPSYKTSPDRSGYYGDYASASSGYGGGGGCCDKKDDLLPILALTALSLLLLYLIAIATTTTTTGKRRRRSSDDNDLIEEYNEIEVIDAPTWLSMVDQLWNGEEDESSDACTLKALCRMNHLAIEAAGSTGMAVSLSSLPLSYLLHHRHQGGFFSYLDASLMGRSGENCTTLYSSCQRVI